MNIKEEKPTCEEIDKKVLRKTLLVRFFMLFISLGLIFIVTAWTFKYWEGWAYIFTLAVPMGIFGIYAFIKDPKFLERRMRTKEKRKEQKLVLRLSLVCFPLIYILPGFDKRFGWSEVSLAIEILGFVMVLLGYLMVLLVFKENSYASRIIEVDKTQTVISTGLYSVVRHPMYLSSVLLYLFTPLALGSYFAVIPAMFIVLVFVLRILDEEKELIQNLDGYMEYIQKVKYRLIPGIW
ncbi:MAG: isoprenylcysteine carboxylmethyltransferase family protein [Bacillota bacterium]|nr:isoprenylcysteine carboxylmethyltransferase family protein [Bacillota bacterium]